MRNPARLKNKWVLNFIKRFFHTYSQLLLHDNCILACRFSDFSDTVGEADREGHGLPTELGMVSSILGGSWPVMNHLVPSLSVAFKENREWEELMPRSPRKLPKGGGFCSVYVRKMQFAAIGWAEKGAL